MPTPRVAAKLLLAGMALGGVLAGHVIAHLVAVLSSATRHTVLVETGHVHWWVAAVLALAASLSAVGCMALCHTRAGAGVRTRRVDICRWLALRLAAAQFLLYLAGEAVGPVVAGVPPADLLHRGPLLRGFLAQLLVALLATMLVGWLARAAALVEGILVRTPRLAPAVRRLPHLVVDGPSARSRFPSPLTARGPPSQRPHLPACFSPAG